MRLEARGLGKHYSRTSGDGRRTRLRAFDGVDLTLTAGATLGVAGSSGAGKSSLARCLAMHERPDTGRLTLDGKDVASLRGSELRSYRRRVQLVFQDAARSFNPGWSARRSLEEPMRLAGGLDRARLDELVQTTGLGSVSLDRPALGFSGGQLRRLNLARALSLEPEVLILDEPFSGLDLSLQGQIANLVLDLQAGGEIAIVCISHDLRLIRLLAEQLLVLEGGRVIESGSAETILEDPKSSGTRALLAASPGSAHLEGARGDG